MKEKLALYHPRVVESSESIFLERIGKNVGALFAILKKYEDKFEAKDMPVIQRVADDLYGSLNTTFIDDRFIYSIDDITDSEYVLDGLAENETEFLINELRSKPDVLDEIFSDVASMSDRYSDDYGEEVRRELRSKVQKHIQTMRDHGKLPVEVSDKDSSFQFEI